MNACNTHTTATLSEDEQRDLAWYEIVIEESLAKFYDVGQALKEIHDGRLYRTGGATWESYCVERWGFCRRHADNLIKAARIVSSVRASQSGASGSGPLPGSERVARALGKAPKEQQAAVWDALVTAAPDGEQPTAAAIEQLLADGFADLSPENQLELLAEQAAERREKVRHLEKPDEQTARENRTSKHLLKAANAATHLPEHYESWRQRLAELRRDFEVLRAGGLAVFPPGATLGAS